MYSEIIITVNSLESCRYFYRENLKLGEPFIDSPASAVFKLSDNTRLVLEEKVSSYLEHASSAISWALTTEKFDEICSGLEDAGHLAGEEFIRLGRRTRKICDPEGNPLLLIEAKN